MRIEHKMGIPSAYREMWQENAFATKEIYISDARVEVPFL